MRNHSYKCIRAIIGFGAIYSASSGGGRAEGDALPLSPNVRNPAVMRGVPPTTIEWDGAQITSEAAILILTEGISDGTFADKRLPVALEQLGRLAALMKGKPCIDDLIRALPNMHTPEEKCGMLLCLSNAEDPRALPVFYQVLQTEKDSLVRLVAADALAEWNVVYGVEELGRLLSNKDRLPNGRTEADEAANSLGGTNRRNAWGFPEQEIREMIVSRNPRTSDEAEAYWIDEWKKWWGTNKQRFPDWKPGDPLPNIDDAGDERTRP